MDAATAAKYPGMTENERIMAVVEEILNSEAPTCCECGDDFALIEDFDGMGHAICRSCARKLGFTVGYEKDMPEVPVHD